MAILSNLLPGLRDLRTPLAAGYAWLLALWLLLSDVAPVRRATSRLVEMMQPLAHLSSPAINAGLVTIAAFLLGSLWTNEPGFAIHRFNRIVAYPRAAMVPGQIRRDRYAWFLARVAVRSRLRVEDIHRLLSHTKADAYLDIDNPSEFDALATAAKVLNNFDAVGVAVRLHIANERLWDQYDRLHAEAEFRLTLSAPIALAAVALAWHSAWWLGVAVAYVAAMMYRSGDWKAREANGVLIQCLTEGVVPSDEISKRSYDIALPSESTAADVLNKHLDAY